MNTFYFIEKKPPSKLIKFGVPILFVYLAIVKVIYWYYNPNGSNFIIAFILVATAMMYISTIFKPYKKSYISINETFIEWLLPGAETATQLNWTDILWVKFEDDGVSLYQQSSFCDFISFKNLEKSDKEIIKELIEGIRGKV